MADIKEMARQAALAAADWYVNSQVKMTKPFWDANHGRFIYTYHMPSKQAVLGINWTQARAIMVLLGAYELTGRQKYLAAAGLGGEYIRNLQMVEPGDPRLNGAIREEVPCSWYVNVRDSAEGACGLMHLYRVTGSDEYLARARLWAAWYFANCVGPDGWPRGKVYLHQQRPDDFAGKFFQAGGAHVFYYLFKATGLLDISRRWPAYPVSVKLFQGYACNITPSPEMHGGIQMGPHMQGGLNHLTDYPRVLEPLEIPYFC